MASEIINGTIVFLSNKNTLSGKLTHFFTGCYTYHVGIVLNGKFYDMYWMRRRRKWFQLYKNDQMICYESPVNINQEVLDKKILDDNDHCDVWDRVMFGIRPIFHFFGQSTRNNKGIICSEQVNNDLIDAGWESPWSKKDTPPSPCDLLRELSKGGRPTNKIT